MILIGLLLAALLFIVARFLARTGSPVSVARGLQALAAVVAILAVVAGAIAMVPAGNVGVVDLFGEIRPQSLEAGLHPINPLARVHRLSIQTQELKETIEAPSREGLALHVEVSVLYHLDGERAAELYRSVGESYRDVLLIPQFRSVVRGVTASADARALYTSERLRLSEQIATELRALVAGRGLTIESTPLRKVTLPERLAAAIEEKLAAEQESQRMEFVLTKEKQEATRKSIEAQGIADFQRIVTQGISEPLLRWKGIEATTKLAESSNAKVVVIGAGKDGLPVLLSPQ